MIIENPMEIIDSYKDFILKNFPDSKVIENAIKEYMPSVGKYPEKMSRVRNAKDNFLEAVNPLMRLGHLLFDIDINRAKKILIQGDHIATMRSIYSHHGIYDGGGGVYEYQGNPNNLTGKIVHSSLKAFAKGDNLYVVNEKSLYPSHIIVDRAIYRLHEDNYHILFNNCEHFATWCRLGEEVKINGKPKHSQS